MINQTPSRQQATAWNIVRHTFNISHGGTDNFEWRHCCMTQIQDYTHGIDHDLDNQVAIPFLTTCCANVVSYRSHPTKRCAIAGIYRSQPARHGLDRADLTYEGSICTENLHHEPVIGLAGCAESSDACDAREAPTFAEKFCTFPKN